MNLFSELENQNKQTPLAEELRPKTLEEFLGNNNIFGEKVPSKFSILCYSFVVGEEKNVL